MPVAEGQLPLTYFHRPTGRGDDYLDLTGRPAYPFGHGLGYSAVEYESIRVEPSSPRAGDSVIVRVRLHNTGRRPAVEVVQLYLRDEIASVARPVLMLAGSAIAPLAAGEAREVALVVPAARFAMRDAQLQLVTEPGRFVVLVGASSADIRQRAVVTLRAP
ncbi:MAG: fibronectin type III-like domain-contianing protein [Gemmatimonadetes bacterium]|nr:fibronectin type III-like domain-contianing protein [Gemmatimonadota bacterium]